MNTLDMITTVLNHPNTMMIEPARRARLVAAWLRLTTESADKACMTDAQEPSGEKWLEVQWHKRVEKKPARCARLMWWEKMESGRLDVIEYLIRTGQPRFELLMNEIEIKSEPWTGVNGVTDDIPF